MTQEYLWNVALRGIQWDDGKGEHDVSELPPDLNISNVQATCETDAIEEAMNSATDEFGSLIYGTEQILATCIATLID